MDTHKRTVLFWVLVIGIFLIIFLLWLPQFVQSIRLFTGSVRSGVVDNKTSDFQKEWKARTEEMKNNFDLLLKQTTTTVQSGQTQQDQSKNLQTDDANKGKQPVVDIPPKVKGAEPNSLVKNSCVDAGGVLQTRKDKEDASYDVCIFQDGSECEETMFQKGDCKIGATKVAEDLMKKK